jgi:hypothetical protein
LLRFVYAQPAVCRNAPDIVARELGKVRADDPRKLLCAIGDFQRILLWGWLTVFGSHNFYDMSPVTGSESRP